MADGVRCQKGYLFAPFLVAGGVSAPKRVFSCTKCCSLAEFGVQEGHFLHRKLSGRKSPYSNSVVRKRYMVGNMKAALARENITASAIGMPLDLRNRDASG